MFRVLACLSIAMAIRSQDNVVLRNVMSCHNEVVSVIRHHFLLTLPSLMTSRKGKCCMILSIISVGRSMSLVKSRFMGYVGALIVCLLIFAMCDGRLTVGFVDGLVLYLSVASCVSCVRFLAILFIIVSAFLLIWFPDGMRPLLGCISLLMPFSSSLILVVHMVLGWLGIPQ